MTFDNGTWWLVGGLVSILIYTFGKMINILFNKVIIEPINEFKRSVENLTAVITELKEFIVKQDEKNKTVETGIMEVGKKIENVKDDTEKKVNELWIELEDTTNRMNKQDKRVDDLRYNLDNFKSNQEKFNKEILEWKKN